MSTNKFSGEDVKVITISALGIALVILAGMCLWFAVQGSMVAAMTLTGLLFGGGFLVAQRAAMNNNAADNAQLIAAITRRDELPADHMYKVLQQRARAEQMVHKAESEAAKTAQSLPTITPLPVFDTQDAAFDID